MQQPNVLLMQTIYFVAVTAFLAGLHLAEWSDTEAKHRTIPKLTHPWLA